MRRDGVQVSEQRRVWDSGGFAVVVVVVCRVLSVESRCGVRAMQGAADGRRAQRQGLLSASRSVEATRQAARWLGWAVSMERVSRSRTSCSGLGDAATRTAYWPGGRGDGGSGVMATRRRGLHGWRSTAERGCCCCEGRQAHRDGSVLTRPGCSDLVKGPASRPGESRVTCALAKRRCITSAPFVGAPNAASQDWPYRTVCMGTAPANVLLALSSWDWPPRASRSGVFPGFGWFLLARLQLQVGQPQFPPLAFLHHPTTASCTMPVPVGSMPQGAHGPSTLDKLKMGGIMGGSVGLIIGFIFGFTNIVRFGPGPNGMLRTLGQYMMASAATFGFFMAIGTTIRTDSSPIATQAFNSANRRPMILPRHRQYPRASQNEKN